MGVFDQIGQVDQYVTKAKTAKPWKVKVEGRMGAINSVREWIDVVGGKIPHPTKEDGKPKRMQAPMHETDKGWMANFRYGTQTLAKGPIPNVRNQDDAINICEAFILEVENGDHDQAIIAGREQMAKDRAKGKQ